MNHAPPDLKRIIVGVFDRSSGTYDDVGVDYFTVFGRRLVSLAGVAPGERVLDAGCGRGAATFAAAEAVGASGHVTAIDLAPGMVERTAADARERGYDWVEVSVGDAEAPAVTGPYDVVLSALVIFFLPDPVAAIRSYRALLAPGGRLALTTFPPQPEGPWAAVGRALERWLPMPVSKPDTGPLAGPEKLAETLRGNGFADVTTTTEPYDIAFRDRDHWWSWAWSHGQRGPLELVPAEKLDDVRAELYGLLDPAVQPDGSVRMRQYVTYTVAAV